MTKSSAPILHRTVRKKNGCFDIPPERTLQNIDQLILESANEDEIKELRQHKRLLKNRKAAYEPPSLDSRYRKKKYTEELEEDNGKLQVQLENLTAKYDELLMQNGHLLRGIDALKAERKRLVEKQSDPNPTTLPFLDPDEFSVFSFDIDNLDEIVMVDGFAMDWQMLSVTN